MGDQEVDDGSDSVPAPLHGALHGLRPGLLFPLRHPSLRGFFALKERCPPRQNSRVERVKAKVEPQLT